MTRLFFALESTISSIFSAFCSVHAERKAWRRLKVLETCGRPALSATRDQTIAQITKKLPNRRLDEYWRIPL